MVRGGSGGGSGGGPGRMAGLQRQLQEIEQQVAHKYSANNRAAGPRGGEGQRVSDQVQIYLRDGQGARGGGGDSAAQAVLMAELQTVRHLLTDASMAMAEVSQEKAQLEEELNGALDELRSAKQSWQAAEMSLRVQSETSERLNAQVGQLTEELRQSRDVANEWRTKAEDLRLKLERRAGAGSEGASKKEMMELEAKLAETNRLRLLDAEKLAQQMAALERLEEVEERALTSEKAVRTLRQEADDWRAKSEGFAAELLAWRSKSESWEATKAQSVRALQSERDRLQTEWQMMRESLQSAEASLAVQTAAVQRLEQALMEDREKLREANRALEGWIEKEEAWKSEVLAMRTRMESEAASKDRRMEKLQEERDGLQGQNSELENALQSAEASLAVQTAAVQRVEKQASTLMVEVRQCRRSEEEWRVQGEEARAEVAALQIQFNEAVRKKQEAMQELHQTREQLEGKMDGLRKAFAEADARCKLYMTENDRLQKDLTAMRDEMRRAEQLRKAHEELEREHQVLKGILKGSGASNAGDALKEVQAERDRLLREMNTLRPKLSSAETTLASKAAIVERLEADLQQHKFLVGESQGKVERLSGEVEGYKAEVGSLRMQNEDALARAEHAISTLREERDLLHSELERLRNALQAASAEMNVGMQAVAKLSNVDARTVSSQVRVYGESQGMQNQLHAQMDNFRRQVGALRGGAPSGGGGASGMGGAVAGGPHASHGIGHDEFRPSAGRVRRNHSSGGRPDGGAAGNMAGAVSFAGPAAGSLLKSRAAGDDDGRPDGGSHDPVHSQAMPATRNLQGRPRPTSVRVHRPLDKFVAPPSRYMHKDASKYSDLALVEQAAEWLSAQRGRQATMPSDADFRAAGMSGVADAIHRIHGGFEIVATKLGMQLHYTNACAGIGKEAAMPRDPAYWNTFRNVQQVVLELAQALCAPDTMPSYMALRSAGLGAVADAIRAKHGGLQHVAQRLGLQLPSAFAD
jgi:chromosome segregation ATPase